MGLLYALPFIVLTALAAFAGAIRSSALLGRVRLPRLARWELALVALLGVYVVFAVVVTAAPISSEDALAYHAAGPALSESSHHLRELWWSWESYQPFTVELLVLDGFLLWDGVQGAFAPLLLGLASLVAVVGAAERIAGRTVALLAGVVFFAQPFMLWQATSTFVEPGLALVIALACWNLWRFAGTGQTWCVALAGIFTGAAAGMKYTGVAAGLRARGGRRGLAARASARAPPPGLCGSGARGGAAVVREERGADRQSRLPAALRRGERRRDARRRGRPRRLWPRALGLGRGCCCRSGCSATPTRSTEAISSRRCSGSSRRWRWG